MEKTVFIATSDKETQAMLEAYLPRGGLKTQSFASFQEIPSACEVTVPDIIIMDISSAREEGLNVCSALRSTYPGIWIIVLSDGDTPYDRVTGLMIGCDEYMCKPFLHVELQARLHAICRREAGMPEKKQDTAELSFGSLTLYPEQRSAVLSGEEFPLTPTEFDFLALLVERFGGAVSREELLNKLWKVTWNANTRAIDDLVKRLRKKMRSYGSSVTIETVWGYGFRLVSDETE